MPRPNKSNEEIEIERLRADNAEQKALTDEQHEEVRRLRAEADTLERRLMGEVEENERLRAEKDHYNTVWLELRSRHAQCPPAGEVERLRIIAASYDRLRERLGMGPL